MQTTQTNMQSQLVAELVWATRDVFKTMVFQDAVPAPPPHDGSALKPGSNVVGTVAFVYAMEHCPEHADEC